MDCWIAPSAFNWRIQRWLSFIRINFSITATGDFYLSNTTGKGSRDCRARAMKARAMQHKTARCSQVWAMYNEKVRICFANILLLVTLYSRSSCVRRHWQPTSRSGRSKRFFWSFSVFLSKRTRTRDKVPLSVVTLWGKRFCLLSLLRRFR